MSSGEGEMTADESQQKKACPVPRRREDSVPWTAQEREGGCIADLEDEIKENSHRPPHSSDSTALRTWNHLGEGRQRTRQYEFPEAYKRD